MPGFRRKFARIASLSLGVFLIDLVTGVGWAQKKGGEQCEKDSDWETNSCRSGTCDPCPDRNNCPSPGTCSQSELDSYQGEVTRWCKGPDRSCGSEAYDNSEVDCGSLKARLEVGEKCIKARDDVMNRCFK